MKTLEQSAIDLADVFPAVSSRLDCQRRAEKYQTQEAILRRIVDKKV